VSQLTIGEFLEYLPVSGSQRLFLSSRLVGSFGADLHNIALRMLGDFSLGENSDYYRLAKGNQALAEGLAAQLPDVRLGHVVSEVKRHHSRVIVYGRAEDEFEIVADAVILAIPVKLLAKLPFDPPLPPEIDNAISSVPMGTAAKLAVGSLNQPAPFAVQDTGVPFWCWCGRGQGGRTRSAVTAFCGSDNAQKKLNTESKDPSFWVSRLKSAVPDVEFMDDPIMVDWSLEEWAGGCYSAFNNAAADLIPYLSHPVGRLFFAGEHSDKDSGTMQGAISSGLRAARQVSEVFL
jgi:monoamine oxidase